MAHHIMLPQLQLLKAETGVAWLGGKGAVSLPIAAAAVVTQGSQ